MNVLLIDESQDYCAELQDLIHNINIPYTAHVANDAPQALDLIKDNAFDLILISDRYNSDQCIALLQDVVPMMQFQQTGVLVLGEHDEGVHTLRCIEAGAHGVMLKSDLNARYFHHTVIQAKARCTMQTRLDMSIKRNLYIAEHDYLTDVGNRYLFDLHLQEAVQQCKLDHNCLGLVLVNIERFKMVNDIFGHHIGDATLRYTAQTISKLLKSSESLYRLGGDEFAILLRGLSYAHIDDIGQRILAQFEQPLQHEQHDIHIKLNMGVAFYPQNAEHADQLLRSADIAEHCAREHDSESICFVDDDIMDKFHHCYFMEQSLRKGINNDELVLHYQPLVEAESGKLIGCEALVRWHHPEEGLIFPDRFIAVAEETGLILDMGKWIVQQALSQLSRWRVSVNKDLIMAINISPQQLYEKRFIDYLNQVCLEYRIPPQQVELEITETVLLKNTRTVLENLKALVKQGYRIALDDFGTGYSSIQHLHQFPISTVKIDKSMMPNSKSSERSQSLLNGLVSMLNMMHLSIVAEGVETPKHVELCRSLGVKRLQGYHFSRPVPASKFELHPLVLQSKQSKANEDSAIALAMHSSSTKH